jgi:secreted PhoX family phosphatase
MTRRALLRAAAGTGAAGAALTFHPGLLGEAMEALARRSRPGRGPYGPLGAPDANGIALPSGFRARLIARANVPVAGTTYPWHIFPDAMGSFATGEGGFVLVSNSEVPSGFGGASAIRFGADGEPEAAYRILSGTSTNCAGGVTPWGPGFPARRTRRGRSGNATPAALAAQSSAPRWAPSSTKRRASMPGVAGST